LGCDYAQDTGTEEGHRVRREVIGAALQAAMLRTAHHAAAWVVWIRLSEGFALGAGAVVLIDALAQGPGLALHSSTTGGGRDPST